MSQLRETCAIVTHIEEVKEKKNLNPTLGAKKIKEKELALLCSQLAIVLTSGLPIVRCIEMVAAQAKSKELRALLSKTAEDIAGGYSLAQSFENNGKGALPIVFIETVRAGESSGTLEICFQRLHQYYDKISKTKGKIVSILTYPIIVCVVAVIVFLIIMLVAVPMFVRVFESLQTELPSITRMLIGFSGFLLHYWWVLFLVGGGIALGHILMGRSEKGKLFLAEGKLKRSPLKKLYIMNESARFAHTVSTMLTAGLPVTKALEVTANVAGNYVFRQAVRQVRQGVEQGRQIADCMAENPVFPKLLTEMAGVGERSGSMEQTLNVIAAYYDSEVEVTANRLLALLEPALTIGIALIAVVLLLAVYLPMFSIYGSIG